MKPYMTPEQTARLLGCASIEEARAKYGRGNRLAANAVRAANAGDSKAARAFLAERAKLIK
jgi:hypothetical protein